MDFGHEKRTVLNTSVGADDKQFSNNYSDNYTNIITQGKPLGKYLYTKSMTELFDTAYQPKTPVIDGLLYAGTYLFAGSPKA